MERHGGFRADHDGARHRGTRQQNDIYRCDLSQSAPHRLQLAVEKGGRGRLIGRTKGGLDTKLHAVTDAIGRPIRFFMTAGEVRDYTGARALVSSLPAADCLLGDRGYDADWFREALAHKGITPCIPGRKSRGKTVKYPFRDIAAQCTVGQWTSAATANATGSRSCSDA